MCLVHCEGVNVVGAGVKCSVKVCIKGCCGVSVSVGVFKILYISRSRCVSRVLVSVLSGHVKGVGMSQYLSRDDDVGLSEGVSIVLAYVRRCLIGKACSKS